ncbi:unnamed protein product [Parajaminaea phylloscopi]
MNSLSLLDSFLSRSLSATRQPSPPDSPGAGVGTSSSSKRRKQHPTTPAAVGEDGEVDPQAEVPDTASSSTSSRLARRNSDHVLQSSRNRMKRSDHLSLGFGMTAARPTESQSESEPKEIDSNSSRQTREDRDADDASSEQSHTRGHPKSYSEGVTDPRNGGLRRSGSSPATQSVRDPSLGLGWGSSLWGLGSWLEANPSSSSSAGKGTRKRRSHSNSSKQWDYPPGEELEAGGEEAGQRKSSRKRRSHSRSKDAGSASPVADSSQMDAAAAEPASCDSIGQEQDGSDGTSSSSGSSTGSEDEAEGSAYHASSRLELSGRLLFANRILTPFHHPALTASVPNLPSEVGLASVGVAGLGGMEDVDTVDFEGEESDTDEAGEDLLKSGQPTTPPTTPGRESKPVTPTAGERRLRRSATTTPLATPGRHHRARDDYFGPRAVERELGRRLQHSTGTQRSLTAGDQRVGGTDREERQVSAELQALVADASLEGRAVEEAKDQEDVPSLSADTSQPHQAALPVVASVPTGTSDQTAASETKTLLPPATLDHEKPQSVPVSQQVKGSHNGVAGSSRPLTFWRKLLIFLRRTILALVFAPFEAITFVFELGKGEKTRLIEVKASSDGVKKTMVEKKAVTSRNSLTFADGASPPSTQLANGDKKRPPTPMPPLRPQDTPVEDSDSEPVTEEQAKTRAEKQAAAKVEQREAPPSRTPDEGALTPTRRSKLLPNPHSVDPMLIHEPKAKKVTGEIPEEMKRRRERFTLESPRSDVVVVVDKVSNGDVKSHGATVASSEKSPAAASPSPSPRSAVIHHTPKILVLDLDETLIHSTSRSPTWTALRAQHNSRTEAARNAVSTGGSLLGLEGLGGFLGLSGPSTGRSVRPHMVEVVLDGRSVIYHVYKRPWVDYFLRKVAAWYHVVIFTASVQEYADPVIDWLDQGRGLVAGRLFRDACTYRNGSYLKNLAIVDEDLSRVCLVDNSPASYHLNPSNGIPIEGWTHDPSDEALLDLLPILDSLRFAQDVRHVLGIRITDQRS